MVAFARLHRFITLPPASSKLPPTGPLTHLLPLTDFSLPISHSPIFPPFIFLTQPSFIPFPCSVMSLLTSYRTSRRCQGASSPVCSRCVLCHTRFSLPSHARGDAALAPHAALRVEPPSVGVAGRGDRVATLRHVPHARCDGCGGGVCYPCFANALVGARGGAYGEQRYSSRPHMMADAEVAALVPSNCFGWCSHCKIERSLSTLAVGDGFGDAVDRGREHPSKNARTDAARHQGAVHVGRFDGSDDWWAHRGGPIGSPESICTSSTDSSLSSVEINQVPSAGRDTPSTPLSSRPSLFTAAVRDGRATAMPMEVAAVTLLPAVAKPEVPLHGTFAPRSILKGCGRADDEVKHYETPPPFTTTEDDCGATEEATPSTGCGGTARSRPLGGLVNSSASGGTTPDVRVKAVGFADTIEQHEGLGGVSGGLGVRRRLLDEFGAGEERSDGVPDDPLAALFVPDGLHHPSSTMGGLHENKLPASSADEGSASESYQPKDSRSFHPSFAATSSSAMGSSPQHLLLSMPSMQPTPLAPSPFQCWGRVNSGAHQRLLVAPSAFLRRAVVVPAPPFTVPVSLLTVGASQGSNAAGESSFSTSGIMAVSEATCSVADDPCSPTTSSSSHSAHGVMSPPIAGVMAHDAEEEEGSIFRDPPTAERGGASGSVDAAPLVADAVVLPEKEEGPPLHVLSTESGLGDHAVVDGKGLAPFPDEQVEVDNAADRLGPIADGHEPSLDDDPSKASTAEVALCEVPPFAGVASIPIDILRPVGAAVNEDDAEPSIETVSMVKMPPAQIVSDDLTPNTLRDHRGAGHLTPPPQQQSAAVTPRHHHGCARIAAHDDDSDLDATFRAGGSQRVAVAAIDACSPCTSSSSPTALPFPLDAMLALPCMTTVADAVAPPTPRELAIPTTTPRRFHEHSPSALGSSQRRSGGVGVGGVDGGGTGSVPPSARGARRQPLLFDDAYSPIVAAACPHSPSTLEDEGDGGAILPIPLPVTYITMPVVTMEEAAPVQVHSVGEAAPLLKDAVGVDDEDSQARLCQVEGARCAQEQSAAPAAAAEEAGANAVQSSSLSSSSASSTSSAACGGGGDAVQLSARGDHNVGGPMNDGTATTAVVTAAVHYDTVHRVRPYDDSGSGHYAYNDDSGEEDHQRLVVHEQLLTSTSTVVLPTIHTLANSGANALHHHSRSSFCSASAGADGFPDVTTTTQTQVIIDEDGEGGFSVVPIVTVAVRMLTSSTAFEFSTSNRSSSAHAAIGSSSRRGSAGAAAAADLRSSQFAAGGRSLSGNQLLGRHDAQAACSRQGEEAPSQLIAAVHTTEPQVVSSSQVIPSDPSSTIAPPPPPPHEDASRRAPFPPTTLTPGNIRDSPPTTAMASSAVAVRSVPQLAMGSGWYSRGNNAAPPLSSGRLLRRSDDDDASSSLAATLSSSTKSTARSTNRSGDAHAIVEAPTVPQFSARGTAGTPRHSVALPNHGVPPPPPATTTTVIARSVASSAASGLCTTTASKTTVNTVYASRPGPVAPERHPSAVRGKLTTPAGSSSPRGSAVSSPRAKVGAGGSSSPRAVGSPRFSSTANSVHSGPSSPMSARGNNGPPQQNNAQQTGGPTKT